MLKIDPSLIRSWKLPPAEAIAWQRTLAAKVIINGVMPNVRHLAGIDVAFDIKRGLAFCSAILFSFPGLDIVEEHYRTLPILYPYIPGLLTFREGPVILEALKQFSVTPDILIFDGQGIAHPRRLGIASHMGVLLDMPAIGCAKSRLSGEYEDPVGEKGSRSYLYGSVGEKIGVVLRTRQNVKPVFISPGHRIGIDDAADFIMSVTGRYRVPIPTRIADIRAGEYKRGEV